MRRDHRRGSRQAAAEARQADKRIETSRAAYQWAEKSASALYLSRGPRLSIGVGASRGTGDEEAPASGWSCWHEAARPRADRDDWHQLGAAAIREQILASRAAGTAPTSIADAAISRRDERGQRRRENTEYSLSARPLARMAEPGEGLQPRIRRQPHLCLAP